MGLEQLVEESRELSKILRNLMRVLITQSPACGQALQMLDMFWKLTLHLLEKSCFSFRVNVRGTMDRLENEYAARRAEMEARARKMNDSCRGILARYEELIKKLSLSIDRLKTDKDHLFGVLQDREFELAALKDPKEALKLKYALQDFERTVDQAGRERAQQM